MTEDDRPLILVVCSDPERLALVRGRLRDAGLLPASGRSVTAAVSLLSQVRINGCALVDRISAAEREELEAALQRYSPNCTRFQVRSETEGGLSGWEPCEENAIPEAVWTRLRPVQPR